MLGVELGGRLVSGTDVVPVTRADAEPLVDPLVEPGAEGPDALPVLEAVAEELVVEAGAVGVPLPGWASAPPLQALSSTAAAAARAAIDPRRVRFG
ncbi:MAG: hypothetical protein WKF57_04760 [Nakamurella sp.]